MAKKEITKLTPLRREVLEALRDGGMITIDRQNWPWLGDRGLQSDTRDFLTDNDLVTRLDKSRPIGAKGNGFVISEKGLSLLAKLPSRRKTNAHPEQDEPSPPTEQQLAEARGLGINVPADATLDEVNDLIYLGHGKPASDNHKRIASFFGVKFTRFVGKKRLYRLIFEAVSRPTHELDLAAWFTYRVYRHLVRGSDTAPITGPDHPTIRDIATQLSLDEAVLRSIRRYDSADLLFFGEWTSPDRFVHRGGSTRTVGYAKAVSLLRDKLGLSDAFVGHATDRNEAPATVEGNTLARRFGRLFGRMWRGPKGK